MAIDWDHIGRSKFDKIVEALLDRLYQDADEVRAFDGRGGDGGRDVIVRQGERLRIFQLKYFPGGFSGAHGQRRRQISKSFEAAMDHQPAEWILVTPGNLTPSELKFIEGLAKGKAVKVSDMGRAKLDSRLAAHPNLLAYFQRDETLAKAQILQREADVMSRGGDDLVDRVRHLGRVMDDVDKDWTFDFRRDGDSVTRILRAQHPRASERSPITLSLQAEFGPEDEEIRQAVERVLGYGVREQLDLPAHIVKSFEVQGPPLVARRDEQVRLVFKPIDADGPTAPIALRFIDASGTVTESHTGIASEAGESHRGRSLKAEFYDALTMLWLMPNDPTEPGTIKISLTIGALDPGTVIRVLDLKEALSHADRIEVRLSGARWMSLDVQPNAPDPETDELFEDLRGLSEDLEVVQRHCKVHFPIPELYTVMDRIELRCARLLLEGHCVAIPGLSVLRGELSGEDSELLRYLLSGQPARMMQEVDPFGFELFGHDLMLGRAQNFNLDSEIRDANEIAGALDSGTARGLAIEIRPRGTKGFWTILPEHQTRDPDEPITLSPWGIPGVEEHPDVASHPRILPPSGEISGES
jgi:hypothetical protein